jgi:integrase
LLALQWPAVNFDTGIITIAHRLEQTKPVPLTPGGLAELTVQERRMREQGLRIKETKGRKIRQLRLSEEAIQTLRGIQARQEENRRLYGSDYCSNLDLVFCHPDGFFIRPDTVTKAVRRLAKKAAFAGVSLHTLRHSQGSQLLSSVYRFLQCPSAWGTAICTSPRRFTLTLFRLMRSRREIPGVKR